MSDQDESDNVVPLAAEDRRQRARAEAVRTTRDDASMLDSELRMLPRKNPVFRQIDAGKWHGDPAHERDDGLPVGCPVVPLGYEDHAYWFLSARQTLFKLVENGGKGNIQSLFTPYKNFPIWAWPSFTNTEKDKKAKPVWEVMGRFEVEQTKEDLMMSCVHVGPYDPMQRVRGRGAWLDTETGGLVLHLGDRLITPTGERACGVYGQHAYPRGPELPPPADDNAAFGEELPGQVLMKDLLTWNWARPEIDARLMLGWTACAMVGGALRWRPYIFTTGDAGSGKTTLVKFAEVVLGGEQALLHPIDTTESGVAQSLGCDSIPVVLDEIEHKSDSNVSQKMFAMARLAASAGQRLRGSADGKPTETKIQSPFMFAGIDMPTASDADMTRMAVLAISPLAPDQVRANTLDDMRAALAGRALHRQMIDWFRPDPAYQGLPMFEQVLDAFRDGLRDLAGHDDRGADTFGYLMAGYWCATEVRVPQAEDVADLVAPLHRATLAEYENIMPGWRKCFNHLLDATPHALDRQTRSSVRAILESYRDGKSSDQYNDGQDSINALRDARKLLVKVGLHIKFNKGDPKDWDHAWLFVPNISPSLKKLFEGERWSPTYASEAGGWASALRGGNDRSAKTPIKTDKMHGGRTAGTSLRLAMLMDYRPSGADGDDDDDAA